MILFSWCYLYSYNANVVDHKQVTMNIYTLVCLFFLSSFYECGKIKMVDEPFSFNAAQSGTGGRGGNNQEPNLVLRYIPGKPSGPPYLIENLDGKCFSLLSNNYKYELCPFNNITQREQAYRWNAFNGILGVWKEWLIDGDNFTSMHMVHGDPCTGNLERETKVNLACGEENAIVSVSEPSMCKYEMIFNTPYACPKDVFLVYPILSEDGKEKWREIEKEHAINVTTEKGYKKNKKKLLINEGLCAMEDLHMKTGFGHDININNGNQHPHERPVTSSGIFAQDILSVNNHFATKQQCDVEYTKLLAEVEMLRQQLRNINLMSIQSALGGSNTLVSVETTIKPMEESTDYNNGENSVINLSQRNRRDNKHKKGDLGLHDKNITEDAKPSHLPKLDNSNDSRKSMLHNKPIDKNINTISKVKKMLKKRKKGDDGILDEKSFPMRNLMGRLEYEANVISRLKVHGRLRDGQRKGGEPKL